jgi:predicted metal-dependent peptidase
MSDPMLELEDTFAALHAVACDRLGDDFFVNLSVGKAKDFPAPRNMAYTTRDRHGDILIVVAPKLAVCEDVDRVEGVLRHEFGHAALWYLDKDRHSERDADAMCENLFGDRIYYDAEDVQTLAGGNHPRPSHLPK